MGDWKRYPEIRPIGEGEYLVCLVSGKIRIKHYHEVWKNKTTGLMTAYRNEWSNQESKGYDFYNTTTATVPLKSVVFWRGLPDLPKGFTAPERNNAAYYLAEISRLEQRIKELEGGN